MEDIITKVGQVIKEKRLLKGYSTQELAEVLDVSAGLINNIENGKTDTFNLIFMKKVCDILEISILSILANESEEVKGTLNIACNANGILSNNVNDIIEAYLQTAIKLNYDLTKLERVKEKVVYELSFISDISR